MLSNVAATGQVRVRSATPPGPPDTVKRARLDSLDAAPPQAGPSTVKAADTAIHADAAERKSGAPTSKQPKRRRFRRPPAPEPGSSEDVILRDVMALIGPEAVEAGKVDNQDYASPLERGQEVELLVSELSSNGESISLLPSSLSPKPWAVLVPFALPGEVIHARVYANARFHSLADLVAVEKPNEELRDMDRVKCRYFGVCAGCQYQMLSYETQLQLKRRVVEKAYQNFSGLPSSLLPPIQPTIPSPKTYGYRTKITPHFDVGPSGRAKKPKPQEASTKPFELTIGFGEKGRRRVIDIEECVIATPILNKALGPAREDVQKNIHTYKRGATLLLRDSLRKPSSASIAPQNAKVDSTSVQLTNPSSSSTTEIQPLHLSPPVLSTDDHQATTATDEADQDDHICITDHKATVHERVGDSIFEFPAGSFFQNNNSVLPSLVEYVKNAIFSSTTPDAEDRPTHLVDTYCGSGLFAISLAPSFAHVAGVEISADSIVSAQHNARLNGLPPTHPTPAVKTESITFSAGKSESIFESVNNFPPTHTVIVIDPPRKGCDKRFLEQLVKFRPAKLVYVSCNVHTQARDLGDLVRMMEEAGREGGVGKEERPKQTYVIESLRGLDLFPQTSHVESVAVLRLESVA